MLKKLFLVWLACAVLITLPYIFPLVLVVGVVYLLAKFFHWDLGRSDPRPSLDSEEAARRRRELMQQGGWVQQQQQRQQQQAQQRRANGGW
jgi:hypothetical protein